MKSRERVLAALNRQETSRLPVGEIGGGYTEVIVEAILGPDYRRDEDAYFHNHRELRQRLGADIIGARLVSPPVQVIGTHPDWGTDIFRDFWGASYTQPPEATVQLVDPIAETPHTLSSWQPPHVENFGMEAIQRWKRETDLFVLATLNAGFDLGYELLGFERFMMWTIQAPGVMADYFEKLIDANLKMALRSAQAGADGILIADDLAFNTGTFVDPNYLREAYFPLVKRMVTQLRETGLPVFLHSDGDLRQIIPDLIDCGYDVLQSCDPNANMNIPELKLKYGDKLSFMGNIDVDLLASGTPDDVREATRTLIRQGRSGGGLIIGASNVVASYCKPENVKAMYATVHEEILP